MVTNDDHCPTVPEWSSAMTVISKASLKLSGLCIMAVINFYYMHDDLAYNYCAAKVVVECRQLVNS